MIRFFKFNPDKVLSQEIQILKDKRIAVYILKKVLYLFFLVYATEFVAKTIPYFDKPFVPAYFIGAFILLIYFIRFINQCRQLYINRKSTIQITRDGITVTAQKHSNVISAKNIKYIEYNLLGNLVIREEESVTTFSVDILVKEQKELLFKQLQDLAPKRTLLLKKIWEFFDAVGVALIFAVHIIQFVIQAYYIPSPSMRETLVKDDQLFVEKITYGPTIPKLFCMDKEIRLHFLGIRKVQRGDIVIFLPPHETNKEYIKRCIALPGDNIQFKDGFVYLNGKKQDEPYTRGKKTVADDNCKVEGVVPPGKVVVLGDNRVNSSDSRVWGYLDIDRIKGRAFILYWNKHNIRNLDFSRLGLIH